MRSGAIKSSWLRLENRLDAGFWLSVTEYLAHAGVDPNQATDDQVRAAIKHVTNAVESLRRTAREMRDQAAKLVAFARKMERDADRIGGKK